MACGPPRSFDPSPQSLLYGGAQPQIEGFRDFEIPVELQERHGYPALTAARKDKILGRNAARLFCLTPIW